MKVTFCTEEWIQNLAFSLPEDTTIGAQYDAIGPDERTTLYAVLWEHPDEDQIVLLDTPVPTLTVEFWRALPTLSEVFGLNIPCQT